MKSQRYPAWKAFFYFWFGTSLYRTELHVHVVEISLMKIFECVAVSQMPRLWVGGAEAEIDARSNNFKRKRGKRTHCIHGVFYH